jgi:hypothetical protein
MATIKKAQAGIKKSASKMVPGEMTGKMYKKSAIDAIGDKQAKELDKSGVFGKTAMAKKKAQNGVKKALTPAPKKKTGMDGVRDVAKYVSTFGGATERDNPKQKDINIVKKIKETGTAVKNKLGLKSGGMIKRADGSYSKRGLWDNLRSKAAKNKATGAKPKAPSKAMLSQEKKIKAKGK